MILIDQHSRVSLQSTPDTIGVGILIERFGAIQHTLWFADRDAARAVLDQARVVLSEEQQREEAA